MKIVRFLNLKDNTTGTGILDGNDILITESYYSNELVLTGKMTGKDDVRLLCPAVPTKVVAVGLNYRDHISEFGRTELPKAPVLFIKLPHTIIGPLDNIILPASSTRVDYEAELAVVISKDCKNIEPDEAEDYIMGGMCLNDVTERDMQKSDGQWTRAKNFETFCPAGPWIETELDWNNLDISLCLNGEIKQKSNTGNMIWKVEELVSFISKCIPLYQGDIVTTGTPCGVGQLKENDIVEVTIEGIGTLKNKVIEQR